MQEACITVGFSHISGADVRTQSPNVLIQLQERGMARATQRQHFMEEFPGCSSWWPWQTCSTLEKLEGASELQLLHLLMHLALVRVFNLHD